MNYDGWTNKETQRASLYLKNEFKLYKIAWSFQKQGIKVEIFATKLKEVITDIYLKEKHELGFILYQIKNINFKEIADDFYAS